ncbi:hypothetical protein [Cryobacterium sp. BB736]|uniref:hypothetical protein n=1 Tax=Cryobacterium sp. BB736 TaxID=2746963 RepID=UPI001874A022|nr:hypothetical protein [Cryobacterium sp. BB736]
MHARTSIGLTSVTALVTLLTLVACSSPAIDPVEDIAENIVETEPDVEVEAPEPGGDPATKGLSPEAIDGGYTIVKMPSGWPGELPLPDGHPVTAMRSGSSFYLVYDLSSVKAGEEVIAWYESKSDWTLEEDWENDGVRVMTFDSVETNDYGPLRRVILGLGMTDWPTGFQYNLEVRED